MWKFIFVLALVALVDSYKILVLFPVPSRSHGNLGDGVVRNLLKAGHEITYATPFPSKMSHPSLKTVDLSDSLQSFNKNNDIMNLEKLINKEHDLGAMTFPLMLGFANMTLSNDHFQAFIRDPQQQFDLVIAEWMFSDVYSGLGAVFKAPFIWLAPFEPNWMMMQMIDELTNPSYTLDMQLSSEKIPFSFVTRARQLLNMAIGLVLKNVYVTGQDEVLYNTHLVPAAKARGVDLPPFEVPRFNVSMILGNSHVSLGEPMSLPQSFKPIGGYHIDTDTKPLPEDLQQLMDNAKHGVIYFSMGSILKSDSLPNSIKMDLVKLFGKLKQTIIWKFEDASLIDMPKNVYIVKWAPQPSILNHPNLKIFITHGGLLSTTEAVHFGVPIIGMPVFGDQFMNINRAATKGFARSVEWSYDVATRLETAINDILDDPKYTNKAKELKFLYHDRVVPPGVELAHWARHVIETRGAPLLRSPALTVRWYQKYYVDLAVVVIGLLVVLYMVVKRVLRSVCGNSKKVKKH